MRTATLLVILALSGPALADTATPDGGSCSDGTTSDADSGCSHVGHMLNPVSGASVAIGFGLLLGIRRKRTTPQA